jgi:murein DD-endopeptidase MepM/ murein hydrolase activator NlpD
MRPYQHYIFAALLPLLILTACSTPSRQAVVEDREPLEHSRQSAPVTKTYEVVAGDTLSSIARYFGVSPRQLQDYNKLANPHQLEIGDRLLIPVTGTETSLPTPARQSLYIWPLSTVAITSAYGSRGGKHKGVDLRAAKGEPIRAVADGIVDFSGRQSGYGRVVILKHGNDVRTLYAHNKKNKVKAGQRVARGETIAKVGASGNASGAHLHFEFIRGGRSLDPQQYLPPLDRTNRVSVH